MISNLQQEESQYLSLFKACIWHLSHVSTVMTEQWILKAPSGKGVLQTFFTSYSLFQSHRNFLDVLGSTNQQTGHITWPPAKCFWYLVW